MSKRLVLLVALACALPAAPARSIPLPERSPAAAALLEAPQAAMAGKQRTEAPAAPTAPAVALTPCVGGLAGAYPCSNVDLAAFLPLAQLGGAGSANDCWGWTDSRDGHEYAIVGLSTGTAFVDVTNPVSPVWIGSLPTHTSSSTWRDIKTYANHAFIVSEASNHGMQVFDLTQLQGVASPPVTFTETAFYGGFGSAHNIVINESTGYAYGVGTTACSGGLAFVDISTPTSPVSAGCFSSDGYTHDAQVVIYTGPDVAHQGREIAFAFNEDTVTIVDVTNKNAPVQLSRTGYSGRGYTHQGWVTEDHRYLLMDDELDEQDFGHNTLTRIWNIADLDNPFILGTYAGPTTAIDHNLYVKGNFLYEANYRAGLRILDLSSVGIGNLSEVAFFDIYPSSNSASFNGAWNVYPYFASGTVIVSGIEQGLFVLLPQLATGTASISGQVTLNGEADHSGVTVLAPGAGVAVTNAAGNYTISNVAAGTYDVTASKAGFIPQTQTGLAVGNGQVVTGVDFTLYRPTGSISGVALLCGGDPPAGTSVSTPGGSTVTAADGSYTITGLFDGTYDVTASRAGYLDQVDAGVAVSGGGAAGGVNFELATSTTANANTCPGLAIPDNNATGVTSTLVVAASIVPEVVRVNVQISHTWVGDLIVKLQHPDGTTVTLLDRPGVPASANGCSNNNMNVTFDDAAAVDLETVCSGSDPWYVGDALPSQPLAALAGKNTAGSWKLIVSDVVGSDTGTIDCWSLELVSSAPCVSAVDAPLASVATFDRLDTPRPNPFGQQTEVAFSLARGQDVTVAVYDALGRRVRTLKRGPAEAGRHVAQWDGRDGAGQRVADGIYFVRLDRSEGPAQTRKVTLIR